MKKFKKLIPAVCMLLIASMLMGTTTYAWFSMNRTVTATNMQISAKADSSLVISKTTTFTAGNINEDFGSTTYKPIVMPATLYASGMTDNTSSHAALSEPATKLVYVANGGDVDPNTGKQLTGKTLYYEAATTESDQDGTQASATIGYYYDYVVYVAAEGAKAIDSGKLKLTIPAVTSFAANEDILKAASMLVLVDDTYVITTPIRLKDGASAQVLIDDLSTKNIPSGAPGTVAGAVKVTFRVYVDGALEKDGSDPAVNYVRNAAIVDLTRACVFSATLDVTAS